MKHKASLVLMEQLVMILVFAIAAALCLQVFAKAESISQETARKDQAVALARNAAEVLKATAGDTEAAEKLGGGDLEVTVLRREAPVPGLALAEIQVSFEKTMLFSLETGWQEELP